MSGIGHENLPRYVALERRVRRCRLTVYPPSGMPVSEMFYGWQYAPYPLNVVAAEPFSEEGIPSMAHALEYASQNLELFRNDLHTLGYQGDVAAGQIIWLLFIYAKERAERLNATRQPTVSPPMSRSSQEPSLVSRCRTALMPER